MCKVGYVRVSTTDQNVARQEELMKDLEVDRVYIEYGSGKNQERPKLKEMLDYVREGDTVIVESLSRLARNTKDLLDIVERLNYKKVSFISKKEQFDTTTSQGKLMLTIFGAIAEFERECILQRQEEGIKIAKSEGRLTGRPSVKVDDIDILCDKWEKRELNMSEKARELGISRGTLYRKLKMRRDKRSERAKLKESVIDIKDEVIQFN